MYLRVLHFVHFVCLHGELPVNELHGEWSLETEGGRKEGKGSGGQGRNGKVKEGKNIDGKRREANEGMEKE